MTSTKLEIYALAGVPKILAGDDLIALILDSIASNGLQLIPGDVIVIAQKVVSKSEGRQVRLDGVEPSLRARDLAAVAGKDPRIVELILSEAHEILRCCPGVIIVEDRRGLVLANAGIDASNVDSPPFAETVLLLPADPDASAALLSAGLSEACGTTIGIIINDSIGRAWRNGTVGTAIGVSGLPGMVDLRGVPDLYGRDLKTTEIGLADEIAAAASIMMGQAGEGQPIILVRGVPYARRSGSAVELQRPHALDLFR